jgi:transketolase
MLAATRDGFGRGLLAAAQQNERIVVLSADLDESLRLDEFKKNFPKRFIQCGVAEQNMLGVAMGLARTGKIPFVCSFAVFNPGRNLDQLRLALYSEFPLKIIGGHAGLATGEDGATHQALEDLAITTSLPKLAVSIPADAAQAETLTKLIAKTDTAHYLRLSRQKVSAVKENLAPLENALEAVPLRLDSAQQLTRGKDVTLVAMGSLVQTALIVAQNLHAVGIQAEVINLHTLRPLDQASILRSVEKTQAVLVAAEHQDQSGPAALVAQLLAKALGQQLSKAFCFETLGVHEQFGRSGKAEELLAFYHLDVAGMLGKVLDLLEKKKQLLAKH